MYFNWSKAAFLVTELKVEPQRKATIATTRQYKVRIATNKDKPERIRMNPKRLAALTYAKIAVIDRGNTFQNIPPWTLVISATSNDWFAEPERTATNYSGFVAISRKRSWRCDLGFNSWRPSDAYRPMRQETNQHWLR